MSEADRYFIKKGFSKVIKQGIEEFTDDDGNYIHFDLVIERFTCNCYLSAKELQAINKKVEELRMDMSNKTSDKNVANIEIVIKDCREHLKLYGEAFITADELDRIENILAEREQDKKRIQELEEERDHWHGCFVVAMENSIPKQVVIDKVNEINKKYEDSKDENGESPYFYPDFTIRILQKLLEGEK